MTLEDMADMSESEQDAVLMGLLSIVPKQRVAAAICKVYDDEDELDELADLITTNELPEEDI